jgi:hypothetical protein
MSRDFNMICPSCGYQCMTVEQCHRAQNDAKASMRIRMISEDAFKQAWGIHMYRIVEESALRNFVEAYEAAKASEQPERCKHGVWPYDHCYECEKESKLKEQPVRKPIEHDLKIWSRHFEGVLSGKKKAEYRVNDRDFQVGDTLMLREVTEPDCKYTGRKIYVSITHIIRGGEMDILSIEPRDTKAPVREVSEEVKTKIMQDLWKWRQQIIKPIYDNDMKMSEQQIQDWTYMGYREFEDIHPDVWMGLYAFAKRIISYEIEEQGRRGSDE